MKHAAPHQRLWRSLVRITKVDWRADQIMVIVPSFSVREEIRLTLSDLPASVRTLAFVGKRLHARVNTGAEQAADLRFEHWELA